MAPRVIPAEGAAIEEAVRVLRAGGLVAFPTETVYGLGARALDERAVARVFAAKGRPARHPLIAHVAGIAEARQVAAEWSERAERLARAFWPGPLTVVVPRGEQLPAIVAGGGDSVAVRAPAHPVAHAILAALGEPLAAPSANRYQTLSPTLAAHVVKSLGDAVDLVIDGGPCTEGIESTVVDVRGGQARVLRPGAVDLARLREALPGTEMASRGTVEEEEARAAPGMGARHYAPGVPLVLAPDRESALTTARSATTRGRRIGLVLCGGEAPAEALHLVRVLPREPAAYARALFATLHALDEGGVVEIVVEGVPEGDPWLAVADRLRRAAR
jgi:L-threonylcarbamoyladenylate synthase